MTDINNNAIWIDVETFAKLKNITKRAVRLALNQNKYEYNVENFGEKMHAKTAIIDDKYTVIASMNWTKAGETSNDENTVVIKNKYLTQDPQAEGKDSVNSCFDVLDNDHNGLTDFDDPKCLYLFDKH